MKGKFDACVLWPLAKKSQNWIVIVDRSTARNFTVHILWLKKVFVFHKNFLFLQKLLLSDHCEKLEEPKCYRERRGSLTKGLFSCCYKMNWINFWRRIFKCTRIYRHLWWPFFSPFGYGKLLELVSICNSLNNLEGIILIRKELQ